jgi:methionyl-tRNA formyltransferase
MEMVKKMDAGDMISQRAIPITDADNVGTMFEKLSLVGRELLLDTLPDYLAGNLKPQPQDETKVTFSPNITPEEERIDWRFCARYFQSSAWHVSVASCAHDLARDAF